MSRCKFFIISASRCRLQKHNSCYQYQRLIFNLDNLKNVTQFDHVAGEFKNNIRNNNNFISANVIIMDVDNSHSDNPKDWVNPYMLKSIFKNVEFYYIFSKSHMIQKENKAPRPKFHVYFPLSEYVQNPDNIRRIKELTINYAKFKFNNIVFDEGAKDAARFIFGVENPNGGHFDGALCIDEFLINVQNELNNNDKHKTQNNTPDIIPEGQRHNHLRNRAIYLLSNPNINFEHAKELYEQDYYKCAGEFPRSDMVRIWKDSVKYVADYKQKNNINNNNNDNVNSPKNEANTQKENNKNSNPEKQKTRKKKKIILTTEEFNNILSQLNISIALDRITGKLSIKGVRGREEDKPQTLFDDLTDFLNLNYYKFNESLLKQKINIHAIDNAFNPVEDLINSYKGKSYTTTFDILFFKVLRLGNEQNSDFYYSALRKWIHNAIALALNDNGSVNNEFVLVFQGRQGCGKTTLCRKLAINPEWFYEGAVIDMKNKDTIIQATSRWITELGELDATTKKDQSSLKSFLTAYYDTYRRPYSAIYEEKPRRTAFCATVNPKQFLRDDTGNRRYVVIPADNIDLKKLNELDKEFFIYTLLEIYQENYLKNKNGFRLTPEELEFFSNANEKYTVDTDFEQVFYDVLNWDAPADSWLELSTTKIVELLSDLKDSLNLRTLNANNIGKTLSKISLRDERIKQTRNKHLRLWCIPPRNYEKFPQKIKGI